MTLEQFSDRVRKKNQWKFLIDITIAGLVVVAGLFIFFKLYNSDWFERSKPNATFETKLIACSFCVGLMTLGIYGIRKVKRDYQILTLTTHLDKKGNDDLVSKIADRLKWTMTNKNTMTEYLGNTHPLLASGYEIRILTADRLLHLDIQSLSAGVIDFGDKARLVKKIKNEIATYIQQSN